MMRMACQRYVGLVEELICGAVLDEGTHRLWSFRFGCGRLGCFDFLLLGLLLFDLLLLNLLFLDVLFFRLLLLDLFLLELLLFDLLGLIRLLVIGWLLHCQYGCGDKGMEELSAVGGQ